MGKNIFYGTVFIIIVINSNFLFTEINIDSYFYSIVASSFIYIVAGILLLRIDLNLKEVLWLIICFFILKLATLNISPIGSDDYYRYLWDGKILINGINPFKFSPNAKELEIFHSEILPSMVSFPKIKTIYFPLS